MAGHIPEETIDEIRKSNDIVDVVGEYVQLKKQGRNYFGLCPFHGENTPSFSVSPDKQIFHCFGCGKGGNAITFLMELEGYEFLQAVKHLADKVGYQLPEELSHNQENSGPENEEAQKVLEAHQWLSKLYHHLLKHTKEGKEGLDYLLERGFTEEMIDRFQLGYAPNSKDFVVRFLEKKGYHPQLMVKAGLLSSNDSGEYSDRFRGRVIFPIRNHLGKTVAFGGRAIHDQEPKYLNSPETELFRKGKLLYNFDLARSAIRKQGSIILFEGYIDVIAAYQAGVYNGVGTLGTSITEHQANLIRRYVEEAVICYDGDAPGIEASMKAARLLKGSGCTVKLARLPDGMDPDDYIKSHGADKFRREVLEASDTYLAFIMRHLKKQYNLNLEGDRIAYVERVVKEIAGLDHAIEREHYLKELANEFELSLDTLKEEVSAHRSQNGWGNRGTKRKSGNPNVTSAHAGGNKLLPAFHNAERALIAYMLKNPQVADKVQAELGGGFNISEHQVIVTYLYAYFEEGNEPDVSHFVEMLPDADLKNLVVKLAMMPVNQDISDREINDYIRLIRSEQSDKTDIRTLEEEQKQAEQQNDPIKAAEIAMKIIQLKRQLRSTH
ncbi:DNA primase [Thalassobacillus devorans]|uniref:DNA primase n=1 Tax=Thalassobacillus devorans TaxID=279813 RepID=A0ABQ1P9V1_9BACI|nr:DNA primase [Thalassobacillus devorans]NIK29680.1 DNA primase [Thalassobacillus devorans]GGC91971.1 DNA primase [Thalassobacillus devorans]